MTTTDTTTAPTVKVETREYGRGSRVIRVTGSTEAAVQARAISEWLCADPWLREALPPTPKRIDGGYAAYLHLASAE